jgi:hypothetical protein
MKEVTISSNTKRTIIPSAKGLNVGLSGTLEVPELQMFKNYRHAPNALALIICTEPRISRRWGANRTSTSAFCKQHDPSA